MVHFRLFSGTRRTKEEPLPTTTATTTTTNTTQNEQQQLHQRRRLSIKKLFKQQQQPQPTSPTTEEEQLEVLQSPIRKPLNNNNNNNNNNLYDSPTNASFPIEQQQTNPLSIITSKLRPKTRLTHKSSVISLVESITTNNTNFALKSFRNVRTNPSPTQTDQPELPQPPQPPQPPEPTTTTNTKNTNNNTISRPPSITSISRPSSPSSKISAAAFREARAARNSRASISSSFSDLTCIPNLNLSEQPPTKHARFKSSPGRATSDHAHSASSTIRPIKNYDRSDHLHQSLPLRQQQRIAALGVPSLISQIPDRHAAAAAAASPIKPANGLSKAIESTPNGLYAEHDVLMPPRPAFYGSRISRRSLSSDQSPSRQSYAGPKLNSPAPLNRSSTGAGLYSNLLASSSTTSIRSVPVVRLSHPTRLRSTTTTNSTPKKNTPQGQDPRHLDQWHSDDEEDEPKSNAPVPLPPLPTKVHHHNEDDDNDDDEEDSVPLSKLKKKSFSSLRDAVVTASAAQTLARTRQQLHSSTLPPPHNNTFSSTGSTHSALVDDRRSSVVSSRSGVDKSALDSSRSSRQTSQIPPLPLLRPDLHSSTLKTTTTITHPRGNSPASSSSGSGSGSGSWNFPVTPRDSYLPTPNNHHPAFTLLNPGYLLPIPPSSNSSATPNPSTLHLNHPPASSSASSIVSRNSHLGSSMGQTFINGTDHGVPAIGAMIDPSPNVSLEGRETAPAGYWTPGAPIPNVADLPTPVGVDPFLYAGLDTAQKIALHQRSQLILQMMAVQAQTAAQMHALSGSINHPVNRPSSVLSTTHRLPASTNPDEALFGPCHPRLSGLHHPSLGPVDFSSSNTPGNTGNTVGNTIGDSAAGNPNRVDLSSAPSRLH